MNGSKSSKSSRSVAVGARAVLLALTATAVFTPSTGLRAQARDLHMMRVVAAQKPGATLVAPRISAPSTFNPWTTGACNGLLPGGFGGVSVPGSADTAWVTLQQQAVAQVEEMYGQNGSSDPSNLTALAKARGLTPALMFATLVKAINDVKAGTATVDETNWVVAFKDVVKYGREWMAVDAINRFNAWTDSPAFQSALTNDILQALTGLVGFPWSPKESKDPYADDFLNEAESALWGPRTTTKDGVGVDVQNYPLGTAESATAVQQMGEALAFLNAVGHTQIITPGSGTDSTLTLVTPPN